MEHLFKAKTTIKENPRHEFNNIWVYGDLIKSGEKYYIHPQCNKIDVSGEIGKIIIMHEVRPDTICRFIGLTDKNGQKIWENDIVRCGDNLRVSWHKFKASWVLSKRGWLYNHFFGESVEPKDVEVVGNIFDNPEFLEKL